MNSREKILGRIREALQVQAPMPGHHGDAHPQAAQTSVEGIRHWLPPVGTSWEQQRDLFAQNSVALKTEFKVVASAAAAGAERRPRR